MIKQKNLIVIIKLNIDENKNIRVLVSGLIFKQR
jgi:hypothetical protein